MDKNLIRKLCLTLNVIYKEINFKTDYNVHNPTMYMQTYNIHTNIHCTYNVQCAHEHYIILYI